MKDVPASPLDIFQLHLGDTEHAFRLYVAVKLSGRIDAGKLRRAADRAAAELPILTSRYVGDVHAGRFVSGTEPVSLTITADHPDRVMTTFSPYSGPLFEITVCRGATDTLVFSAAHLLTDARGLLGIVVRIAELVRTPEPEPKQFRETDRTLAPAFRNFSAEMLQELFAREESRFPAALADKKYFATMPDPGTGLTIMREQFSAETLAGMKTFAASYDATIHDLLLAAYGTALRDWLRAKGTRLDIVPLCSTADLRRYFPDDARSSPMNYTVAYWSPVCCGKDLAEALSCTAQMSQEMKRTGIGIGAAGPFTGSFLQEDALGKFAGVPFLTNPGRIPSDIPDFGDDIRVDAIEFQGSVAGESSFTFWAWTYRDVLHLTVCAGTNRVIAGEILERIAEILRRF